MPKFLVELDGQKYQFEGDNPPTEKEARDAVGQMSDKEIEDTQEYSPGQVAQINALNNMSTSQPVNDGAGIVQGISGDVARGALNSFASAVDKINGVRHLLKDVTGIDADKGLSLEGISKKLRESASSQPTLDNPIISSVGEFVGGIPTALAEFAGSGGPVGFIARSAALSAMDEYNKSQEAISLAKGAFIGGTIGIAMEKAPLLLQKASELSGKWGKTAGKEYLKNITGMTDKEADYAVANINKFNLSMKKDAEDFKDIKEGYSAQLRDFKDNTNEMILQKKEQLTSEYIMAKDKSDKIIQDIRDKNSQVVSDLKDNHLNNTINLANAKSNEIYDVTEKTSMTLAEATAKQIQNITKAKDSLDNELISIFDTSRNKLSAMIEGLNKNIGVAKNSLDEKGLAYINTDILKKEIDSVITAGQKKGFYSARSDGNGTTFTFSGKGATPAINGAINLINHVRSNLIDDFRDIGRTSLAAIDANVAMLEEAISKGFNGERLPKELVNILSDIKGSLSLTRIKKSDAGDTLKGLFDKYPEQLKHLGPLAEANRNYSSNIENLREALKLYSDDINGAIVPNPSKVFSAIDKGNITYLSELKKADMALPEGDRILDKVKNVYDKYKFVEKSEKENLSLIEKQVSQARKLTRDKFTKLEQEMMVVSRKELQEAMSISREKYSFASEAQDKILQELKSSQREQLLLLKKQRDSELDALQSSINDRLQFLHVQDILRGSRPTQSSFARLGQNLAMYKTFNGAVSMNPASIVNGLAIGAPLSPIIASNIVKSAINAPSTNSKVKDVLRNAAIKAVLANAAANKSKKSKEQ